MDPPGAMTGSEWAATGYSPTTAGSVFWPVGASSPCAKNVARRYWLHRAQVVLELGTSVAAAAADIF